MTERLVSHKGRVVLLEGNLVSVEIVSKSACASCQAAAFCGASEQKRKIVQVQHPDPSSLAVGQEVEVCLSKTKGMRAVLVSYVIPLIVLLILIVSLSEFGLTELVVGLASLGGLALYYLLAYLLRDHLPQDYGFSIRV